MNEVIQINDYIKKVIEEIETMPEFFKVKVYGGEFNSDDANEIKKSMSKQNKSNALVSFVEAIEAPNEHPSRKVDAMTCVFVIFVLNTTDKGMNGYSSHAYDHAQKVHSLIKNNRFGFKIGKAPNVMSIRNISGQIKQDKEIAKMAVVWSQEMVLAEADRLN